MRASPLDPVATRFSIRRRILALALILLLLSASALILFIWDYAQRASDRAFDRLLGASALTIAGAVQVENDDVIVELPFASFAMFSGADRVFYAVEDATGQTVTGYEDLALALSQMTEAGPSFREVDYRGETVRVASVGRLISSGSDAKWVTIHVAETQSERDALANEILSNAVVPVVALTILAIGLIWFGIGRMFAPLTQLERELHQRSPDDLSPIVLPVPAEVRQLVAALNGFMGRLANVMERLTGLVAEAAHEVRTPLASLRAQAEIAMDEDDPAALRQRVNRIHQGAVQASQLVHQLLMDATISHRLDSAETDPTAFGTILDDVRQRLDPTQMQRLVSTVSPDAAMARLAVDRLALREMLRNVIDNAMVYSAATVELTAQVDAGLLVIGVLDRGPGIPEDEKPRVLERFRRGSASPPGTGSGLGLAIVQRVISAHGGRLRLLDRPGGGLHVDIRMPMAARAAPRKKRKPAPIGLALGLLVAGLTLIDPRPAAALTTTYPAPAAKATDTLIIVGVTDTPLFTHFVKGFQAQHPATTVIYEETDSVPLYERYLSGQISPRPDLLISSASDLMVKLANDGHALAYDSPFLAALPSWAHWHNELFGFTFEPAVTIYNPDLIAADEVPRTHLRLAELLESQTARFSGKVATYDIALSGVGYLLAAQDQVISSNFWRLAAAFGRARAVFSGSSPAILNGVADGTLALGYNVLGSYAFGRRAAGANIEIVVPDDYVLVLTRAMMIPRDAPHPDLARAFVDFALSPAGQGIAASAAGLGAVVPGTIGEWTGEAIAARGRGVIQPIPLGPALMVSLDQQRRSRFLQAWREIVSPAF